MGWGIMRFGRSLRTGKEIFGLLPVEVGFPNMMAREFINFTTSQGLPVNMVYSIIEDQVRECLGIGTAGGGVISFPGDCFSHFHYAAWTWSK
jgi:hypothetical protein